MRDETDNTVIETWEADLTRYEGYSDGATAQLVEVSPPRRTSWSELPLGGQKVVGRSDRQNSPDSHRIDFSGSTQVSKVALTFVEGTFATTVEVGQLGGAHVQYWGSRASWLNHKGAKFEINHRPVSFRIETADRYYWILVNPRLRIVPPQYQPEAPGDGVTDGTRELIPEGSPVLGKIENALKDLGIYYHQFLEWPPRITPVTGDPAGVKSSRKKLSALGSLLTEFGFPKYEASSRDSALLEWLIDGDLIELDELRRERNETIKPKSRV